MFNKTIKEICCFPFFLASSFRLSTDVCASSSSEVITDPTNTGKKCGDRDGGKESLEPPTRAFPFVDDKMSAKISRGRRRWRRRVGSRCRCQWTLGFWRGIRCELGQHGSTSIKSIKFSLHRSSCWAFDVNSRGLTRCFHVSSLLPSNNGCLSWNSKVAWISA